MWIKICANTSLEDAQLAAELGADAVGFVFAPSRRRVTTEQVARITPHLPAHVERVGVFDAPYTDEIVQMAQSAGLNAVQIHGEVSHDLTRRLYELFAQAGQIKIIRTVHWHVDAHGDSAATVTQLLREINEQGVVDRVLIDSKVGQATGGTGITFDWDNARDVFAKEAGRLKLIVAGGLRPENVAEAIRRLNPWGIDVASGVESQPGRKSPEKLEAFIKNARG